MFEHKSVQKCIWYQDTHTGWSSMINFIVISPDLRLYVLDTLVKRVKRETKLSTNHHLVMSWIR